MTTGEPPLFDNEPAGEISYPQPVARTGWWHRTGLAGAIAGFVATGLTVVGSLLALVIVELSFGDVQMSVSVTGWTAHTDPPERGLGPLIGGVPANGAPLVFGAVAMFAGAAVGLYAARHPAGLAYRRLAIVIVAIGAAFLAATVWTIVMQEVAWFAQYRRLGDIAGPDSGFSIELGTGFWLLVAAAVAAIGAAVCTALPAPTGPPTGDPHDPETETPRYGFAVVTRLPDAEPEPPKD